MDKYVKGKALSGYLATFLSKHCTKKKIAAARRATLLSRRVRRSSFHMLLALDHVLQFIGHSLFELMPKDGRPKPLNRVEIRYKTASDKFPYEVPEGVPKYKFIIKNTATVSKRWELPHHGLPRPCLAVVTDRCSVNLSALSFAKHKLECRLASLSDPYHDTWNDLKQACQSAGQWGVIADFGHCFNICAGPWQSWALFKQVQGFAEDYMTQMAPGNELFCQLYPAISRDSGVDSDLGGMHHKKMIFDALPECPLFATKGEKMSLTRWLRWYDRFRSFDKVQGHMHTHLSPSGRCVRGRRPYRVLPGTCVGGVVGGGFCCPPPT